MFFLYMPNPVSTVPDSSHGFINTSTVQETLSRSNSEVSLRSVASNDVDDDNLDQFQTPAASRASSPVLLDEEQTTPLIRESLQEFSRTATPNEKTEIKIQYRNFFGPKTLSVMASIASITCVVLTNTLKLASHTHLGLMIAAVVLLTLAFSLMIKELVATTRGRHFLTKS